MDDLLLEYHEKMDKTISVLKGDLASIRAGRAYPAVLDKITVDYYGVQTPINQVAAISVSEARILVIQPWEPSLLQKVEKAIQASDLGINPQNDGRVIRLVFPQLTEERRNELVKQIKQMGEASKVAVRSIRRDAIDTFKKLEKASDITEDDLKNLQTETQDLTDKKTEEIDKIIKVKENELLEI